jgi:YD repeat-containing protein
MTNKLLIAFFGFLLFSSSYLQGQGQDNCPLYSQLGRNTSCVWIWGNSSLPLPHAPAGMTCCNPGGIPNNESCLAPKPCNTPVNVAGDTCSSCTVAVSGEPINLATGNTYIRESDMGIPGLGGGLSLSRTWNSLLPAMQQTYPYMFGMNWRSNYEERLIYNSGDGFLKYARSDGTVWSFGVSSVGNSQNTYMVAAPANDTTTTIVDGSPNWTLTYKNGEKRLFDATSGALKAIIDRNGNTTQLSYDTSGRLATVADPAGRHLTFNYTGSSTLVSTVTSDVGISLSYSYDTSGRLTQMTKQDGNTISFGFDANSRITSVTDSNGKLLESHTYDAVGRGLTSSRANGVDAVTVTYPQ